MQLTLAVIDIVRILLDWISFLLTAYIILSMLISFNVVNTYNQFVAALWRGLSALFDPVLRPLQRILPDTRPLDLSPIAFIILLRIADRLLVGMALSIAQ